MSHDDRAIRRLGTEDSAATVRNHLTGLSLQIGQRLILPTRHWHPLNNRFPRNSPSFVYEAPFERNGIEHDAHAEWGEMARQSAGAHTPS
jgi:hypothetical protein